MTKCLELFANVPTHFCFTFIQRNCPYISIKVSGLISEGHCSIIKVHPRQSTIATQDRRLLNEMGDRLGS